MTTFEKTLIKTSCSITTAVPIVTVSFYMLIIAHRGNTRGPEGDTENTPEHVYSALSTGFDAEIDVWLHNGRPFLGHDGPKTPVSNDLLLDERIWCHAKTPEALDFLLSIGAHCFFHEGDAVTLTSRGVILTLVGRVPIRNSICMLPEAIEPAYQTYVSIRACAGICTDYAERYREIITQPGPTFQ